MHVAIMAQRVAAWKADARLAGEAEPAFQMGFKQQTANAGIGEQGADQRACALLV
jgi:hypothetical protein